MKVCVCLCVFVGVFFLSPSLSLSLSLSLSKERHPAGRAAWPRRASGSRVRSSSPCSRSLPTPCHRVAGQRHRTGR